MSKTVPILTLFLNGNQDVKFQPDLLFWSTDNALSSKTLTDGFIAPPRKQPNCVRFPLLLPSHNNTDAKEIYNLALNAIKVICGKNHQLDRPFGLIYACSTILRKFIEYMITSTENPHTLATTFTYLHNSMRDLIVYKASGETNLHKYIDYYSERFHDDKTDRAALIAAISLTKGSFDSNISNVITEHLIEAIDKKHFITTGNVFKHKPKYATLQDLTQGIVFHWMNSLEPELRFLSISIFCQHKLRNCYDSNSDAELFTQNLNIVSELVRRFKRDSPQTLFNELMECVDNDRLVAKLDKSGMSIRSAYQFPTIRNIRS